MYLSDLLRINHAIKDLLSIACLHYCREARISLEKTVSSTDKFKENTTEYATFHAVPNIGIRAAKSAYIGNFLFSYVDIENQIGEVFSQWLQKDKKLSPIRGLYFAGLYGGLNLDGQMLALAQAAEVFHRRFRGGTYVGRGTFFDEILKYLEDSIPAEIDSSFKSAIIGRLKYLNEFSLRKRLKELLREHRGALDIVFPKASRLIGPIVNYRNRLVHYSQDEEGVDRDTDKMFDCVSLLRLIIELSFLKEMGFKEKDIRKSVEKCRTYHWRYLSWRERTENRKTS